MISLLNAPSIISILAKTSMLQLSVISIRFLIISSLFAFSLLGHAQTEVVTPESPVASIAGKGAFISTANDDPNVYAKSISRGARYCVINIIQYGFKGIEVQSYSTRRLDNCSPNAYYQLSEASIAAQMRTFANVKQVIKAGFHTLVASRDLNALISPYIYLGEIRFQMHAKLEISFFSYIYKYLTDKEFRRGLAQSSYVPLSGRSPMEYLFNPGEEIHELISPDGSVYTMTSFTDYINTSLTLAGLKDMGSQLSLPPGWQYRTRIAEKQISIKTSAPGYEFVGLFDQYSNYYVQTK